MQDPTHTQRAVEAMRRAKFKYPGRQKIFVSYKFGFTKYTKAQIKQFTAEGRLVQDGTFYRVIGNRGPLSRLPLFKNLRYLDKKEE